MKGKKVFLYILSVMGVLVSSVLLGVLLLATVYNIPMGEWTDKHMQSAAETLAAEGVYPSITPQATSKLDNYTDSIMLLKASYTGPESVFEQAMKVESNSIKGAEPHEIIISHYKDGIQFNEKNEYNRYWHGYLVFLKPLIAVFSYKNIRIINAVMQTGLVLAIVVILVRRKRKSLIAPLLILWAFLMPLATMKSMQFSSCFYIMLLGVLALVSMRRLTAKKAGYVFLGIGICLAYFDLLTYPLVTLGVPLSVYLLVDDEEKTKKVWLKSIFVAICWGVGYLGMWVGKWTIGSLILGRELFSKAINQLLFRTAISGEQYERIDVINNNFESFFNTPATTLFLIYIAIMITLIVVCCMNQKKNHNIGWRDMLKMVWPFLVVAALPVVWFLLVSNHSYHHYWFTNKICAVTVFACMCALVRMYQRLKCTSKIH